MNSRDTIPIMPTTNQVLFPQNTKGVEKAGSGQLILTPTCGTSFRKHILLELWQRHIEGGEDDVIPRTLTKLPKATATRDGTKAIQDNQFVRRHYHGS